MKKTSLLLAFAVLVPPGAGFRCPPFEAHALRGLTAEESPLQGGLEEGLGWTPQSPWIPRKKIRDEMVAWRSTSPPATIKGVQRGLRRAGVTWQKYLLVKELFEAEEAGPSGSFAGMPEVLDATSPAVRDPLVRSGQDRDLLKQFGVVIMAGGEGTRLLKKLIEMGELPPNAFDLFTKPTLPLMLISGKSPLQMQLEVLAAIGQKMNLEIPVVVVVNPDTEVLVNKLLRENGNFGLRQLRIVIQDVSPTLNDEGKILLRDDGLPALNPDGTGGVLRALARDKIFDWFRGQLGPGGRFFLANGDMLVEEDFFYLVAGASQGRPILGVGYLYPPLKADRGIFVRIDRAGRGERLEIVETNYRDAVEGLGERMKQMGRSRQEVVANSGLYAVALEGIETRVSTLNPNARRGREVARAEGIRGNKLEYYATDVFGELDLDPAVPSVLVVDEWALAAMKTPAERADMQMEALLRGRSQAERLGIQLAPSPQAGVEFHPGFQGTIGSRVEIRGDQTRVYFGQDQVWIQYGNGLELLRGSPDIPDNTVLSSDGFLRQVFPIPELGVDTAAGMEIGRRSQQQDRQAAFLLRMDGQPVGVLAIVADGMAGTEAGGEAGSMVVDQVHQLLSSEGTLSLLAEYAAVGEGERKQELEQHVLPNRLNDAIVAANGLIYDFFEPRYPRGSLDESRRPGSTVLAVLVTARGTAFVASVGDSRAYLFSQGKLQQLTPDDTLAWKTAQEQVEKEDRPTHASLSPYELNRAVSSRLREEKFPGSNLLTQSMGNSTIPDTHLEMVPFQEGDQLLLASDGVTGPVNEGKISSVLASAGSPEAAMRQIMDLAQAGSDNRTAVVLQRAGAPAGTAGLEQKPFLPAGAVQRRLVILTPQTVEPALGLFSGIGGGEQIRWTAVFSDDDQAARVMAWANEAGLKPAVGPVSMEKTGMNLGEAVLGLQLDAWAAHQETFVIELPGQLRDLGRFLGLHGASERAWNLWLQGRGLSVEA